MSWFDLVKRVFISEGKAKSDKEKRRRWIFGRFKLKLLPTPAARSQLKPRTLSEAEEEHSKHALTVAIATVAAAEAAVAAAHAAAEVVRLTSNPQSHPQHESERRELAALRIQSAFRGYLARKALRALKGLVRIQAMVRGRAVRRKAITTLKGLQSLVKIQSQIHARRVRMVEDSWASEEKLQLLRQNKELGAKERRLKPNIQRWGDSLLSKDEIDAIFLSRREALINREHTDKFLSIHQEKKNVQRATESELNKADGQWNNWLEKWVDAKVCKRQGPQILDSIVCSNSVHRVEEGGTQHRLREFQSYEHLGTSSPISLPRRSFHQPKRSSIGENNSLSSSPAVPSYMAATESAKAKTRSVSMVKQRMGLLDAYSDQSSPSKNSLSFFSSISSDGTRISKIGQPSGSEQRSPHTKGRSGPIKSHRISKDLSFDSQRSLLNWDQHISFR